jgi:hypothetical protein
VLEHPPQIFTRRRAMIGGVLALMAIVSFALLNGSGGAANASAPPPPSYAAYSALNSTDPTGLPLVTPNSPNAAALGAKEPAFPVGSPAGPGGNGPIAESIRRLPINIPTSSAWIAKSGDGGVCVLASRHQAVKGAYPIAVSCGPASLLESGATVELHAAGNGIVTIAGVVPDKVTSVQVTLTNGATKTVAVADDAWALEAEADIQSTQNVMGG